MARTFPSRKASLKASYRPRTTYQKAKSGIEQSLNELQTDYIDLLLIHEPYKSAPEMYEAFKEALRDGKTFLRNLF